MKLSGYRGGLDMWVVRERKVYDQNTYFGGKQVLM